MTEKSSNKLPCLVGLIPAGGQADRLAPLPCSKEILPLGFYYSTEKGHKRPKVACHFLLDGMRLAGVKKAFIILRPGKWDIPAYFGSGESFGIDLAYLVRKLPFGVPFTLDCAYPFIDNCLVACGLPDIIFRPDDAFRKLSEKQEASGADLVLGLFPTENLHKWDLVELDNKNRLMRILPRPHNGTSGYTWCISVWSPKFSLFLHRFIENALKRQADGKCIQVNDELPMGTVFQSALADGLLVEHVLFKDGFCLDIGTPEDLQKALCMHLGLV